jgi:hypothetical protein
MTPEFPYVQLSGAFHGFLRKASLWEGADHILSVSGTRFSEEYRRFYYRDIEALIVERRARWGSLGWWLVLLIVFVISLFAAGGNGPRYSWIAALTFAVVLALRLDLTFRRSCRCSIQTAVSREVLPSLIRRAAARVVIARLGERITAEQGNLPEDMPPVEEEVLAFIQRAESSAPSPLAVLSEADQREQRRRALRGFIFVAAALLVLLVGSVVTFWFARPRDLPANLQTWIAYGAILTELVLAFQAVRYLAGIRFVNSLRRFMVAYTILQAAGFMLGASIAIYLGALRIRGGVDLLSVMLYYQEGRAALQLALALFGLILFLAKWKAYRRGEPSSH